MYRAFAAFFKGDTGDTRLTHVSPRMSLVASHYIASPFASRTLLETVSEQVVAEKCGGRVVVGVLGIVGSTLVGILLKQRYLRLRSRQASTHQTVACPYESYCIPR